jgi:hypothetical protein
MLIIILFISCRSAKSDRTHYFSRSVDFIETTPGKENVWVFILAGQSNMAGRGFVEPKDTLPSPRVLTINAKGQVILAKEPLHFYEPAMAGLDCGLSFGKSLLKHVPGNISILLIPTAVGGSSISQWLGDSVHRNVRLFSNFRDKVEIGKKYGQVKAILWHQGESDANEKDYRQYEQRLSTLFNTFRRVINSDTLPILIGHLGSYSTNDKYWKLINQQLDSYALKDNNTAVIHTNDFKHKGDKVHFDSKGQRILGKRFAQAYIKKFSSGTN